MGVWVCGRVEGWGVWVDGVGRGEMEGVLWCVFFSVCAQVEIMFLGSLSLSLLCKVTTLLEALKPHLLSCLGWLRLLLECRWLFDRCVTISVILQPFLIQIILTNLFIHRKKNCLKTLLETAGRPFVMSQMTWTQ